MSQPTTIAQFAEACKTLTSDEVFEFFEFEISDALRDEIYSMSRTSSHEPCRDALEQIGKQFNVQSLIDY